MFELMTYSEPPEVDIIEKCLESVLNKGVKVLDIDLLNHQDQSATSFTVSNSKLPSSLMVGVVKFKSLKLLSLCKVTIDEEVIKRLTASCPILKILELSRCFGLKIFCVSGLQNLKYVCFYYNHGVERIDIDVPNLRECGIYLQGDFSIDVEQPMVTQSPTYGLNHIELNVRLLDNLSVYEALVDAILWCCRPQSLTLISDFSAISFEEQTRVVELLQQEAHGKTNIQFVLSSYKPKMIFCLPESVPTTLQRMTFIKEEGVPEEEFGDITIKAMQMWKDDQLN
ncbi:F-box domain containing protein [Tanacetum coccineum]